MTLMGTWITGYWNGLGLEAGTDYDYFPFPAIADGVPGAVVGPIDGLVISNDGGNRAGAEAFLSFMMSNADVQASWTGAYGGALRQRQRRSGELQRRHAACLRPPWPRPTSSRSTTTSRRRRRWRRWACPCSRSSWTTRARVDAILARVAGDAAQAFKE